jgi:hypothetical protein
LESGTAIKLKGLMRLLPYVRRSVAGIVALASVALLIAACGSSSTATDTANMAGSSSQAAGATTGAVSGGTHAFAATLSVTGAVTKSASFTESIAGRPACAAFAQAGIPGTVANPKLWYLPNNPDYTFLMTWDVMTYTGPGTYTGSAANSANLAAGGQQFVALTPTSSTLSVTVNADGSGSATFSNLQSQATKAAVSGSETWTCS